MAVNCSSANVNLLGINFNFILILVPVNDVNILSGITSLDCDDLEEKKLVSCIE